MSDYSKPLPDIDDPIAGPFWAATRNRQLVVQRCDECGYLRWPPGPVCNECQAVGGTWTAVQPTGALYSYAEYHRALDPAFKDDIPYVVGLVELTDGPRMYGSVLGHVQTSDVGKPVRAVFDPVTDDVTLVRWEVTP